jgi:hypothetical protein
VAERAQSLSYLKGHELRGTPRTFHRLAIGQRSYPLVVVVTLAVAAMSMAAPGVARPRLEVLPQRIHLHRRPPRFPTAGPDYPNPSERPH